MIGVRRLFRWADANRLVSGLTALCIVLIVAVGGFVVGAVAFQRSGSVANCVNNVLATRSVPASKDNAAHIHFADALDDLLALPAKASPAQQQAAVASFRSAASAYRTTLSADQVARLAVPFGKC